MMSYKTRVLFVCVANSARSQMVEALLRHTLHEIHERIKMCVLVKNKR